MPLYYSGSQWMNYLFIVNIILALMVVGIERRKPSATLSWLLVMLFLPGLGFVLYLFLGQDIRKERLFYVKEGEEREIYYRVQQQDESLHRDQLVFANEDNYAYKSLIHLNLDSMALLTQDNRVQIFSEGQDLYQAMRSAMEKAQNFIHLQCYIIRNDSEGQAFRDLLVRKAEAGVEVKVLYDGMGCMRLPRTFFQPLLAAGGKAAIFYPPLLPYINLRVNYRNHRKLCVIDGEQGFVGGFNIGEEYLGMSPELGFWRDAHICIRGSALDDMEVRFLLDWRYAAKDNFLAEGRYFPKRTEQGHTSIQIVSSGPDSKWTAIKNGYLKLINSAQRNIYLQTPYFVPDDSILEALKLAALSGVEVHLMIPGKPDHLFIHWASLSYVGELLEAGVRCYVYRRGFLHSKLTIADSRVSSIGTANMDIRSFELNFEVNAFIYDEEVSRELERVFFNDLVDSDELTLAAYLKRPRSVKVKEAFCRLLSPLL